MFILHVRIIFILHLCVYNTFIIQHTLVTFTNHYLYTFFQVNQIPIILHIIEQPGYICHLHTVYSKITGVYVILNKS